MIGLSDWVVGPKFIKSYSNRGPAFAALSTRSVAGQCLTRLDAFNAFAWKI